MYLYTQNKQILIQEAYDISSPKTLSRELTSLVEASRKTGCKNLTLVACSDSRKEVIYDIEINVVSAYEWLLDKLIGFIQ